MHQLGEKTIPLKRLDLDALAGGKSPAYEPGEGPQRLDSRLAPALGGLERRVRAPLFVEPETAERAGHGSDQNQNESFV